MTPIQKRLYDFVQSYWRQHNIAPSYDEIRAGTGMKSRGAVSMLVKRMSKAGYLSYEPGKIRTLHVAPLPIEIMLIKDAIRRIAATPGPEHVYSPEGHRHAVAIATDTIKWSDS